MKTDESSLKEISYRGGLVRFRVPANWREEYPPDGGACFYEDVADSGTLRLETITATSPTSITAADSPRVLADISRATSAESIEVMPSGYALSRYCQCPIERGQELHVAYWSIAQVVPSSKIRVATFSYTLLAGQEHEPRFQEELRLVDAEVRKSTFWPE